VHPAEGIAGLVVVKFGDGAYGSPACGGVAVFARKVERAVGILGDRQLRRARRALGEGLKC